MISGFRVKAGMFGVALILFSSGGLSFTWAESRATEATLSRVAIPVLVYHRFGPVVADSMTVTTPLLESQIRYIIESGYTVIPLRQLVDCYLGKRQGLPSRSVAITVDDGHKTVYTDLFPLVKKYRIPATLFLYPSVLSNASYAMTWNEVREIKASGMFDFQAHTYWHPNFKNEKKRLSPADYEDFVQMQLNKSKEKLLRELEIKVDMLAWPFGIYDEDLICKAKEAGYVSAFTIERSHAKASDHVMALPRYLITHADKEKAFGKILGGPRCL